MGVDSTDVESLGIVVIPPAVRRRLASAVVLVPILLVILWVLFLGEGSPAGTAVTEPGELAVVIFNGLTFAGLLFVVSAGLTLVFGLMRTVNMAHGSLILFSGYIAIDLQQSMVGKKRNIDTNDVGLLDWIVPLLVAAVIVAVFGVLMQQVFLRWNQGEDMRQTLITLGISVILADQMLAHFGGLAKRMVWPGAVTYFFEVMGERYAMTRLFMLAAAVVVGVVLWLWLNRTRMGMIIRAGVDDQTMVRALGINITLVFGITFFVGAFLAGFGGVMAASFAGIAPGADGQWLLHSLVVVIIGGLGSIRGAVAGSLLYGMSLAAAPAYLPKGYAYYAIILTFAVLALVLAVRPHGLFGREE